MRADRFLISEKLRFLEFTNHFWQFGQRKRKGCTIDRVEITLRRLMHAKYRHGPQIQHEIERCFLGLPCRLRFEHQFESTEISSQCEQFSDDNFSLRNDRSRHRTGPQYCNRQCSIQTFKCLCEACRAVRNDKQTPARFVGNACDWRQRRQLAEG